MTIPIPTSTSTPNLPPAGLSTTPPLTPAPPPPETKTLKKLVRDIIDPSRDLGHVDGKKSTTTTTSPTPAGLDRKEDGGSGGDGVMGHDAETGVTREAGEGKQRKEEGKGDGKEQERGKVEGQGKEACEDCD